MFSTIFYLFSTSLNIFKVPFQKLFERTLAVANNKKDVPATLQKKVINTVNLK